MMKKNENAELTKEAQRALFTGMSKPQRVRYFMHKDYAENTSPKDSAIHVANIIDGRNPYAKRSMNATQISEVSAITDKEKAREANLDFALSSSGKAQASNQADIKAKNDLKAKNIKADSVDSTNNSSNQSDNKKIKLPKLTPQMLKAMDIVSGKAKGDYMGIHNHLRTSNTRFMDAINKPYPFMLTAKKFHMGGVAITDHQSLSGHLPTLKAKAKLNKKYPGFFKNFHVALGDEIYLVDRKPMDKKRKLAKQFHANRLAKEQGKPYKKGLSFPYANFYHFILVARNNNGYKILQHLNQKAWHDSFKFGNHFQQQRLPTYKDDLAKMMKGHQGDIVASTACLGSETSQDILNGNKKDLKRQLGYLTKTFGKKNVYLELMPSSKFQQRKVNYGLVQLGKKTGLKTIISTDSHYTDGHNEKKHEMALKAESPKRNVYDFYHYARLFKYDDLRKYFSPNVLKNSAKNSMNLLNSLHHISAKTVIGNKQTQIFNQKIALKTKKVNTTVAKKVHDIQRQKQQNDVMSKAHILSPSKFKPQQHKKITHIHQTKPVKTTKKLHQTNHLKVNRNQPTISF